MATSFRLCVGNEREEGAFVCAKRVVHLQPHAQSTRSSSTEARRSGTSRVCGAQAVIQVRGGLTDVFGPSCVLLGCCGSCARQTSGDLWESCGSERAD
uniref:Uncharacterized protein n=1 Tax=Knipowitschia caucasica TaxID=637954 RepID=A0AAV2LPD0_KNICA